MKKTYLNLVIFLFSINAIYGQDTRLNGDIPLVFNGVASPIDSKINLNIKGSPYITDAFVLAKISISENKVYQVKYNALLDEMEVIAKGNSIFALKNNTRKDITITLIGDKKTYQVFDYQDEKGNNSLGYFVHVNNSSSDIRLIKKEKIKFIKEKRAVTSYDEEKPAQYKRLADRYYIKIKDQNAVLLPGNKKKLTKLFPDYEKEISNFIKSKKIKLSKESDLIKLINFINQSSY